MECVGLSARTAVGGGQLVQPPVPVLLDDASRLRVLHPDLHANSRVVEKTCNLFRSKLLQFHSLVKNLLAHVDEQSKKIEAAKSQAVGTRNMMSAEVETRTELLRDQRNIISDKQEHLERLNAELKSLFMVKQEQEVLIAQLSESSLPVQ
ncbi:intraflagellar transport protein 20 [Marchantia polymorpha subsp. ruderalis]|uniref:Uncharacterized protein n=2 Tax=Marchantia polymorpha TaxID=3197 RepID=A0AAF6B944_MARPO|nr:hypothetical protein MARPO_0011s0211 [Marchantia polymorpha]BBN08528.1 hypothetical protein Mp_4g12290 [Marchantia polymorpha subsp. ruderalis]|eukprot:PTQ46562.1 hypothetical protein MARPO_0011s0211 [Marchantia polymorpha]